MGTKVAERFRWKIAHHLDRSRRFCWADLVTWAMGWHGFRQAVDRAPQCQREASCGGCYCNKFSDER